MVTTITVLDSTGTQQTVNALPALGSTLKALSLPVTIATDQSAVPVSGTVTAVMGSVTPVSTGAAAASLVVKAAPGTLYAAEVGSTSASGWLMLFNTTSAPADGAVTPLKAFQVAANTSARLAFSTPLTFSAGITLVFSSTGPFTKTASITAFLSGDAA